MTFQMGDTVKTFSPLHGDMVGVVAKVTRWRHKVYYHMEWDCTVSGKLLSKERAGRDDHDWTLLSREEYSPCSS